MPSRFNLYFLLTILYGSCFHSGYVLLYLTDCTAETTASQLVLILFDEDEIKTRVGGTVSVSQLKEKFGKKGG